MNERLTLDCVICKSSDVIQAKLDDEIVLMSPERGKYYGLDSVGTVIWSRLEEPITIADLIDRLLEKYDVDSAECEIDTLEFLNSIKSEGLIRKV